MPDTRATKKLAKNFIQSTRGEGGSVVSADTKPEAKHRVKFEM
jgi:hypothetical protein